MGASIPADGFAVVVKRDCPTCALVQPVIRALLARDVALTVFSQDDPGFPEGVASVLDDRSLEVSWRLRIETVPTLLDLRGGRERARAAGWHRGEWEALLGTTGFAPDLPDQRPGCGSLSAMPGMEARLAVRFGETGLASRRVEVADEVDVHEAMHDRGWSDGLPLVPPTEERVLRMLEGTDREPGESVGRIPPADAECSVEKVAANAVMAGCRPEYLPVVLAVVEAALDPAFCLHGVVCTTDFVGPVIVVNGPVARRIGMNSGVNALGQGNRANATVGRALQLVVRNVGGGVPGGIDRSTLGNPGKFTFCFAEDESDPGWEPLAAARGLPRGASAVTVFAGGGVQGVWDQRSRAPESLAGSLARSLAVVAHAKLAGTHDALLVLSPEHRGIFTGAGWDRARIRAALDAALIRPGAELVHGAGGIAEGLAPEHADRDWPKFRRDGLLMASAGGPAGLMSAIITGWWTDDAGRTSHPVTRSVVQGQS